MRASIVLGCLAAALAALVLLPASPAAQAAAPLGGVWSLNRSLSEVPPEIGFNVNWVPSSGSAGQSGGSTGGGRGRRSGSGGGGGGRSGGAFPIVRESYEDSQRVQLLTAEARTPPSRLMIVETPEAVTITNELGQSRTFHPTGRQEAIEIQGIQTFVTPKRDGDRFEVVYRVTQDREVHYTYSHSASPSQLIVEVQFVEHGAGDKARLVYEPASETTTASASTGVPSQGATKQPASDTFDERPGAELRGLKTLGILVEDLSAQAVSCGLSHDAIEAALSKRLTDGGFSVRKNSDEDTYLYVNVMTTSSGGTCVSRYDAFLYTHATAKVSYHDRPVLVQVSLIHRGGMSSGVPPAHATAVTRGLEAYLDTFMTQIRQANQ
jgi:hypothetical protein